jgi:mevalonate pyrophosphate decarboxylase
MMGRTGHVACMGEMRKHTTFQSENLNVKRLRGRPRHKLDDNIKMGLKRKRVRGCGLGSSGSGYGSVAGSCENGNEPLCIKKGRQFLEYLSEY